MGGKNGQNSSGVTAHGYSPFCDPGFKPNGVKLVKLLVFFGPLPMSLTWGCQRLVRSGLPLCFPKNFKNKKIWGIFHMLNRLVPSALGLSFNCLQKWKFFVVQKKWCHYYSLWLLVMKTFQMVLETSYLSFNCLIKMENLWSKKMMPFLFSLDWT